MNSDIKNQLLHYFTQGDLSSSFQIEGQDHLSFHWSSNMRTVALVKKYCLNSKEGKRRIGRLEKSLDYLKDIPVWIASGMGRKRTDLYHIYECYMDPRLNVMWQDFKNVSISLGDEVGPYSLIRSMKWFDEKVYASFIYIKLIRSWVPKRHFRMAIEIPFRLSKVSFPLCQFEGNIHQVTEEGIVLKMATHNLHHLRAGEDVIIEKKMSLYYGQETGNCFSFQDWCRIISDFKVNGDDFSKVATCGLLNGKSKVSYLFIPYHMMVFNYGNQEEVKHKLEQAKRFICDLAA